MADPRTINYAGGQKIDNAEMVSKKIDDAVQPIASDLAAEISRATNEEQNLQSQVDELRTDLNKEIEDREAGDTALDGKIGDLSDLETVSKSNTVVAINELKREIPTAVNDLKEYVDAADAHLQEQIGDLNNLETDDKSNVVAAINELKQEIPTAINDLKEYVDAADERLHEADENLQEQIDELTDFVKPLDEVPTEGSDRIAKSGGTWDAIRFASVKVGETMFWPVCDLEEREVRSDKPFTFTIHGIEYSAEPPDATVDMKISKNIPDGWHACDGKAELLCSEYPELAKFFGGTQNDDGSWNNDGNNVADDWVKDSDELSHSFNAKIWLPYLQQKIIKVKY